MPKPCQKCKVETLKNLIVHLTEKGTEMVYCAECGAVNEPGSTYCVSCNKMLNP